MHSAMARSCCTSVEEEEFVLHPQVCVGPQDRLVVKKDISCKDQEFGMQLQRERGTSGIELSMEEIPGVWDKMRKSGRAGRKKGYTHWTPEENKKFYNLIQKYGSDFQMMETMFSGRTQKELKNKFKIEEKTWNIKKSGLKAWEGDDLILREEKEVVNVNKVKPKKKKQVGPRRRYKNKGFYESSSGEDSDAEDKAVMHKRQAASRVAPSRKVGNCYGLQRMPVLMHLKQEEAPRTTQEEEDRKSGSLLHLFQGIRQVIFLTKKMT